MGVSVRFTPLYGAHSESRAHAYLLSVAGSTLLLDCGWDTSFDLSHVADALRPHMPNVDAVLISHPHIAHLGALPYAFSHLGLPKTAPVYSTLPVWRMGQMFLYDAYQAISAQREFDLFDLDDVDAAFEARGPSKRFHLLKYHQSCALGPEDDSGLVITPHPAGHMLGGAVWTIRIDTESIVFAIDINHRREHHLNATNLASLPRPSHLIFGAANAATRTRALRTKHLMRPIIEAVQAGGSVLIPVDTAGRVVELAVELNEAWLANRADLLASGGEQQIPAQQSTRKQQQQQQRMQKLIPLVVLHEFSTRTFDFARTMIEFMSDRVVKKFDTTRENLFDLKNLQCCTSRAQLDAISGPKVVLASFSDLEIGFSRDIFVDWAPSPQNTVILVDRPEPNTLAAQLMRHAADGNCDSLARNAGYCDNFVINVSVRRKDKLSGDALREWREKQEVEASKQKAVVMEGIRRAAEELSKVEGSRMDVEPPSPSTPTPRGDACDKAAVVVDAPGPTIASPGLTEGQETNGNASKADNTQAGKVSQSALEESSSEDDDDDDDYDADIIMGAATARRPTGTQLLGGRQQQRDLAARSSASAPSALAPSSIGKVDPGTINPFAKSGSGLVGSPPRPVAKGGTTDPSVLQAETSQESFVKSRGKWDDYGQSIGLKRFAIGEDPSAAVQDGMGSASVLETHRVGDPGLQLDADVTENLLEKVEDIPTVYSVQGIDIQVRCRLVAIDRSGLSEGDALKHLVKELEPRRVILVNGTEEDTNHFHHHLSKTLFANRTGETPHGRATSRERWREKFFALSTQLQGAQSERERGLRKNIDGALQGVETKVSMPTSACVLSPGVGEEVEVTSATSVQTVSMDIDVVNDIRWSTVGSSSVGYIDGSIAVQKQADVTLDLANEKVVDSKQSNAQQAVIVKTGSSLQTMKGSSSGELQDQNAEAGVGNGQQCVQALVSDDTAGGVALDAMEVSLIPKDAGAEFSEPPLAHPTVFVGTIMLGRLKEAMARAGVRAELCEGVLYVHNQDSGAVVLVKKVGAPFDTVVIEGSLSEEYYAVRDIIYNELVVVSA